MPPSSPEIRDLFRSIEQGVSEIALRHFDQLASSEIEEKGSHRDLLTIADSACEAFVIEAIQKAFPAHGILGEENGYLEGSAGRSEALWIIDPIDGTTNFARSFPFFAISVGLVLEGQPYAGIVVAPRLGETFEGIKGEGATLNGHQIRVSECSEIKRAILATGFSYNRNEVTRNNVDNFSKMILEAHDIRRPGAASLDLCYVAAGRFDGYWEPYLKPWDVAAGALIASEAGALVSDFAGDKSPERWLWEENICVAPESLHEHLRSSLSGVEEGYQPKYAAWRDDHFADPA